MIYLETSLHYHSTSCAVDQFYQRFRAANTKLLHVYRRLRSGVPQFTQDFYEVQQAPEEIEALQKQVRIHITLSLHADYLFV